MPIKKKTTEFTATAKRIFDNFEQFVQAVALLTVATFSYYATKQLALNEFVEIFVTVALAVIGLRGAYEFFRFLDKK